MLNITLRVKQRMNIPLVWHLRNTEETNATYNYEIYNTVYIYIIYIHIYTHIWYQQPNCTMLHDPRSLYVRN